MNSRLQSYAVSPSDDLRQSLLPVFRAEAAERIHAMNAALEKLDDVDQPTERQTLLERLGRHAHSLKGGARAVELQDVERVCAELEATLARLDGLSVHSVTSLRSIVALVDELLQEDVVVADQVQQALQLIESIGSGPGRGNGHAAGPRKPAHDMPAEPLSHVPAAEDSRRAEAYRILVADDSTTSRIYVRRLLQAKGYRVTDVPDGTEAIAVLESTPVDLLVSDIEMPRTDGLQLTAWVRAHPQLQRLAVILVSGLEREADIRRGRQAGADDYIPRSQLTPERLFGAVERCLPRRDKKASAA